MAFWRKSENEFPKELSGETITSVIGQDMQLVGDVSFNGSMRLDGHVKGNIHGDYLILGESGVVVGDVLVNTIICCGRVDGNVSVKRLQVPASGVINGNVEAVDLEVESGAALNGEVKSRSKEPRQATGASSPKEEWNARAQGTAAQAGTIAGKSGDVAASATIVKDAADKNDKKDAGKGLAAG